MPRWEDEGGWIVVSRRRGGRRQPQERTERPAWRREDTRGWRGGFRGEMARAPPAPSWRGRAQTRSTNRPVPFPVGHFYDARVDTYAAAVRRNLPGRQPRFGGSTFRSPDGGSRRRPGRTFNGDRDNYQRPTQQFSALVRSLFAVIKVVHHLQNVAPKPDKPEPLMIARMVETLASIIKPAMPSETTAEMITGNAKNWGYNTLLILEDHYKGVLQDLLTGLGADWNPDWRPAFEVASRWARRRLTRITQAVIDHAEALITTCGREGEDEGAATERGGETGADRAPQARPTDAERTQREKRKKKEGQPLTGRRPQTTQQVATKQKTVATMTEKTIVWSVEEDPQSSDDSDPQPPRQPSPRQRRRRQGSNVVVSADNGLLVLEPVPAEEEEEVPPSQPVRRRSPLPQRTPRRRGAEARQPEVRVSAETGLLVLEEAPSETDVSARSPPQRRSLDLFVDSEDEEDPLEGPGDATEEDASPRRWDWSDPAWQVPTPELLQRLARELETPPEDVLTSQAPALEAPRFKVSVHPDTTRTIKEWELTVNKRVLILGDSNVGLIGEHSIPDLQIECFPKATFENMRELMSREDGRDDAVAVEKVILSFGIICRSYSTEEAAKKQMRAMLRAAKKRFPQAAIHIPLINFSNRLTKREQTMLVLLNQNIQRTGCFLPRLLSDHFHTEDDDFHWTRGTASRMLEHWLALLNIQAP